jgi:hypothetical protein|tara:strand:+ start:375 stop:584 length:210 start_codon:yes stop_codon:yes gene_type:complete
MNDMILSQIDDTPVAYVGAVGDYDHIYYSTELNNVYLVDTMSDKVMTFSHEEFVRLCGFRDTIELIAKA